jgi:uncharacterized RDD family membrane protein YckC
MTKKKNSTSKKEFLEQVSYWLPYPTSKKKELLQELAQDLQTAYEDTSSKFSVSERWKWVFDEFGPPQKVAENLLSSQRGLMKRANYFHRVLAFLIDTIFAYGLLFVVLLLEMEFIYATKVNLEPFISFDPDFRFYRMMILSDLVHLSDPLLTPNYQFALYSLLITGILIGPATLDNWSWMNIIEDLTWFLGYNITFTAYLTIILAYYFILEGYHGRTLGKFLLRLRVVSETGTRATWQQILTRNISKFNLQVLLLDWLAGGLLKKNRQRGLDMLAKTQVIVSF